MPKIEIMINGKAYPCRQTMGAMLRFKKETGKEVTELGNSLSDMCAYLFCCVASACKHDGVEFDMSLMDFADSLTPEDLNKWTDTVNATADQAPEDTDTEGEKKKLGIFDILGIAVGNIGLPYNDFCALTPEEFSHIYKAYSEERTAQYQDSWERMRMLAAITIQPYAKKGLTPHGLLPFPWEKKKPEHTKAAPAVSKEDALKRFEEVLGKVGKG